MLRRLESDQLTQAGPSGIERWERGWSENKNNFLASDGELSALVPRYIRPAEPVRINQQYAATRDSTFELHWYEVFTRWLFETYFKDAKAVYEFGCGTGHNLASLAGLYPEKKYFGLDWARPSVDIVDRLGESFGWDMQGRRFDFFAPDADFKIQEDSVVFTIGAMEQSGTNYQSFLDYLLQSPASLCIHCEPIVEWYDADNLVDHLAIGFHEKRNYWRGYHGKLLELQQQGRVEILKERRSFFGSLYIEGYSQLIWRPVH